VLEEPNDLLIEQSLRLEFKTSNNQPQYEALIAGMTFAQLEFKASNNQLEYEALIAGMTFAQEMGRELESKE
jgi:ribonuclease HI